MLKQLLRSRPVVSAAGKAMARYLRWVQRSNDFTIEPADAENSIYNQTPIIAALWHGQHFMAPFARRPQDRSAVIISRHGDGEINAIAAQCLGIETIRGSGAQRQDQVRKRGGAEALRAGLSALAGGASLVLTADVPKVSRVAGKGIIVLAQLSGRPVVPLAVVTSRRLDFSNWDCSSIGLPYGKGAIVFGNPIHVARHATSAEIEDARLAVQDSLDAVHVRAYTLLGAHDPGSNRSSVIVARKAASDAALRGTA